MSRISLVPEGLQVVEDDVVPHPNTTLFICGQGINEYLGPPPTREPEPRSEVVTTRITPRQKGLLDRICRREAVSRSEIIFEMISWYIENDELYED